jgi:hypothetical protein
MPSLLAGDAIADDVDGGLPDVLAAALGDAAAVDDVAEPPAESLAEPHAATRQTLEMPMEAPSTAVRAVVAIRELNMLLIGPVNHCRATASRLFLEFGPALTPIYRRTALTKAVGRTCYSLPTAAEGRVIGHCASRSSALISKVLEQQQKPTGRK